MSPRVPAFVLCLTAMAMAASAAPPRRTVTAVHASNPVKIDGELTEDVWQTPGFAGFTQQDPQDGQGDSTLTFQDGVYTADPDGPGPAQPFTFGDPDFRLRSLRGTIVLRWEYRPGSMLYFVWTQKRADESLVEGNEFWQDMEDIVRAPGDNVFLLKFSYLFNL